VEGVTVAVSVKLAVPYVLVADPEAAIEVCVVVAAIATWTAVPDVEVDPFAV
jgi:hypothetical protein